jgi:hypothetical protein
VERWRGLEWTESNDGRVEGGTLTEIVPCNTGYPWSVMGSLASEEGCMRQDCVMLRSQGMHADPTTTVVVSNTHRPICAARRRGAGILLPYIFPGGFFFLRVLHIGLLVCGGVDVFI